MNATARRELLAFTTIDWFDLGYTDPTIDPESPLSLEGPIHAVFQFSNAQRKTEIKPIWPQHGTPEEYEALCNEIGQVLILATLLLESPASLDFLYYLIYSIRTGGSEAPILWEGEPVEVFGTIRTERGERYRTGRAERHRMARAALDRLSKSLTFMFEDPADKDSMVKGSNGLTRMTRSFLRDGINLRDDSGPPSGVASYITLNKQFLTNLKDLRSQGDKCKAQVLSLQLKMAVTIDHEMAHAVGHAVDKRTLQKTAQPEYHSFEPNQPVIINEPFYGTEHVAELGYSWENAVFGGVVMINWQDLHQPLFFVKWPTFLVPTETLPTTSDYKGSATMWVVPLHFIRNMFRQPFWESVEPTQNTALNIKKIVGVRVLNNTTEIDDAWNSESDSEEAWPTDGQKGEDDAEIAESWNRVSRGWDPDTKANETARQRFALWFNQRNPNPNPVASGGPAEASAAEERSGE